MNRKLLLACLAAMLVVGTGVSASPHEARSSCGVWRWPVKTLSDRDRRDVDFSPHRARIKRLRALTPPGSLFTDAPRISPVETHVYSVKAQVVTAVIEDDSDIHLVIAIRGQRHRTMIVEFPDPACVSSPFKRDRIRSAKRSLVAACGPLSSSFTDLRGRVTVQGVGFWDEDHGQTGVAPNAIELHPVLRFQGTCRRV